jgi:hypothetical protein
MQKPSSSRKPRLRKGLEQTSKHIRVKTSCSNCRDKKLRVGARVASRDLELMYDPMSSAIERSRAIHAVSGESQTNVVMTMATTMVLVLTLSSERNYKTGLTPWKKRMQNTGIRMLSRGTRSLSLSKPTIVPQMSSARPTGLWLPIAIS